MAVDEEVIRAREDRYMAKEKRRQIFCMLTKPRTARCEFGEEPAEDQYDDIQAVNDIKRFICEGRLPEKELRLKAKAHVRANVNPGAHGITPPIFKNACQNDSTAPLSRPCPICKVQITNKCTLEKHQRQNKRCKEIARQMACKE